MLDSKDEGYHVWQEDAESAHHELELGGGEVTVAVLYNKER